MKIILLTSGVTKPEYFGSYLPPKCLINVDGDKTILDKQMEILSKYHIPITMVIGYKGQEVIEYCKKMHYDINFEWDKTYHKEYSVIRLIRDNNEIFKGDIIILFADTLFKDEAMEYLLNVKVDIAKAFNLFKMTSKGIDAVVNVINNGEFEGLNSPLLFSIEEQYPNLKISRASPPIWQFDVDRSEELVTARQMYK